MLIRCNKNFSSYLYLYLSTNCNLRVTSIMLGHSNKLVYQYKMTDADRDYRQLQNASEATIRKSL